MIKFALKCECGHRFDSWFRDNNAYEALKLASQLSCPACGKSTVAKAPMAPGIPSKKSRELTEKGNDIHSRLREAVVNMQTVIQDTCDDVGESFAEEARKIHYGEAPKRGIYGKTTDEEAESLEEEDIEFVRLPWVKSDDA